MPSQSLITIHISQKIIHKLGKNYIREYKLDIQEYY